MAIDLITRDENIRWLFPASIDNGQVGALAAVLAESMSIPDVERDELRRRHLTAIDAGTDGGEALTASEYLDRRRLGSAAGARDRNARPTGAGPEGAAA